MVGQHVAGGEMIPPFASARSSGSPENGSQLSWLADEGGGGVSEPVENNRILLTNKGCPLVKSRVGEAAVRKPIYTRNGETEVKCHSSSTPSPSPAGYTLPTG